MLILSAANCVYPDSAAAEKSTALSPILCIRLLKTSAALPGQAGISGLRHIDGQTGMVRWSQHVQIYFPARSRKLVLG